MCLDKVMGSSEDIKVTAMLYSIELQEQQQAKACGRSTPSIKRRVQLL